VGNSKQGQAGCGILRKNCGVGKDGLGKCRRIQFELEMKVLRVPGNWEALYRIDGWSDWTDQESLLELCPC